MRGWRFPDDFVAAQVRQLVSLSLPGGRLHERDLLVVACGDDRSVARTQPAEFAHSIVLRAFRRTAPNVPGALQAPDVPRHGAEARLRRLVTDDEPRSREEGGFAHEEPATEQSLGCRPIRVCDEDEEVTDMDMGHVAGEDQSQ